MRTRWWVGAVVVAAVGVLGCENEERDSGAFLACRTFRQIGRDYTDGLLTDSELLGPIREVQDDARISDIAAIRTAGRSLVDAATNGTEQQMVDAINQMGAACQNSGY